MATQTICDRCGKPVNNIETQTNHGVYVFVHLIRTWPGSEFIEPVTSEIDLCSLCRIQLNNILKEFNKPILGG